MFAESCLLREVQTISTSIFLIFLCLYMRTHCAHFSRVRLLLSAHFIHFLSAQCQPWQFLPLLLDPRYCPSANNLSISFYVTPLHLGRVFAHLETAGTRKNTYEENRPTSQLERKCPRGRLLGFKFRRPQFYLNLVCPSVFPVWTFSITTKSSHNKLNTPESVFSTGIR